MLITDIISIIGVGISTLSLYKVDFLWMLLVGRTLTGFCIGVNMSLIPIYICEICPVEL